MPKRRADADSRRFFDEFECVKVGRFRAMGVVDPAKRQALIPWPSGKTKLLNVTHNRLKNGGGWSFFICPGCSRRAGKLWDVEDAPRCVKCCKAMNIQHRGSYGFGRKERREAYDKILDALIAKVETKERLSFKPWHPTCRGSRAIMINRRSLTRRMRERMVTLRLNQLATQQTAQGTGLARAYQPLAEAKAILDLKPIWRARTTETLNRALDKAQGTILKALDSPDVETQIAAAKLLLRTKQARQRGF